jgi:hypothetical protein
MEKIIRGKRKGLKNKISQRKVRKLKRRIKATKIRNINIEKGIDCKRVK